MFIVYVVNKNMAKCLAWWSFEESNLWIFFTKELNLSCLGNKRCVHDKHSVRTHSSWDWSLVMFKRSPEVTKYWFEGNIRRMIIEWSEIWNAGTENVILVQKWFCVGVKQTRMWQRALSGRWEVCVLHSRFPECSWR